MFCWGSTVNGELGLGGIEEEQILVPRHLNVPNAARSSQVRHVACGEHHTLFLFEDGTVFSCGSNDVGQLGHSRSCKRPEMVEGLAMQAIRQVACGSRHSLALTEWGEVYSWGDNGLGQLGRSPQDEGSTPRLVKCLATKKVVQLSCGADHCLALTDDGSLYSWGSNNYGQLGLGTVMDSEWTPTVVHILSNVPIVQVACGSHHSFVVTRLGAVYGWGRNSFGQLGVNDERDRSTPTNLMTLRSQPTRFVCCGENHTVILTRDGGVFTFGAGAYGQLGHGSLANEILPRMVLELMGHVITQISCGRRHTLAYEPKRGRIYAFGQGGSGQLGNNSSKNSSSPAVVGGPWVALGNVVSEDEKVRPINDSERDVVVGRIFSGGDRSFVATGTLERTTVDDFRNFSKEGGRILRMEVEMADRCAAVTDSELTPQELIEYVETVFGSPACVNASFVNGDDNFLAASRDEPFVDLSRVKKFFKRVGEIEKASLTELMLECIRGEMIPELVSSPLDSEALRVYLIILQCSFFDRPTHHGVLCTPIGRAILNLGSEAGEILAGWWGHLEPSDFLRLVTIYKSCVVQILDAMRKDAFHMDRGDVEGLSVATRILDRLNTVNNDCGRLVPYEDFYIPEVTEVMDVRLDYINWLNFGGVLHASRDPSANNRMFLCNYPFLFDAKAKTLILQTDAILQMQDAMEEADRRNLCSLFVSVDPTNPYLVLIVSRENLVQETLGQLIQLDTRDLKKPLKVVFCGEDAVDAGGVRKEFFMLLLKEVIDPKYGMFKSYDETLCIWFNEQTFETEDMFYLIGLLCGLAIYNGNIINLPFPVALYKKLLEEPIRLEDIKGLSPTLQRNLQHLLDYEGDDFEDVFMLKFEIGSEAFGEVQVHELIPGGSSVTVTRDNRNDYVQSYVDFLLNVSVDKQYRAFHAGFHKVCGGPVLQLFHAQELMAMVVGNENYDWSELERNAEYKGVFSASHPTIRLLWEVFHELSHGQKKKFLLFLTGYDRIPIFGMKSVKILIQPTAGGQEYLPVAHTCFNLLDLPLYTNKEQLRQKLLLAIEHTQGFALA